MKLPGRTDAVVSQRKIVEYLLSSDHPRGRYKAEFFRMYGFDANEWTLFADALRNHAAVHDIKRVETSPFGTRYVVEGPLWSPQRGSPLVRSVWFIPLGETNPRLVTAYPLSRDAR